MPDALYPFDPAVWRAIREFDPNTLILMTKRAYRAPTGEVRVFRYHTLASHRWSPANRPDYRLSSVLTPTWLNMPQPTHVDLHLENRKERTGDGLPGAFVPFDWRVYHALRASYREWEFKDAKRYMDEKGERALAQQARLAALERVAERVRKDGKWLKERFSRIDKHDAERLISQAMEKQKRAPMVSVA